MVTKAESKLWTLYANILCLDFIEWSSRGHYETARYDQVWEEIVIANNKDSYASKANEDGFGFTTDWNKAASKADVLFLLVLDQVHMLLFIASRLGGAMISSTSNSHLLWRKPTAWLLLLDTMPSTNTSIFLTPPTLSWLLPAWSVHPSVHDTSPVLASHALFQWSRTVQVTRGL